MLLPITMSGCLRATPPAACRVRAVSLPSDEAVVLTAAVLAGAAGYLQYSVSSGEKGLNAFLMKEKSDNPFYSKDFKAEKPSTPSWFTLRLPNLDFVEVYGQSNDAAAAPSGDSPERARLYRELDAAVEREDYDEAARIKARIDEVQSYFWTRVSLARELSALSLAAGTFLVFCVLESALLWRSVIGCLPAGRAQKSVHWCSLYRSFPA
eukprot:5355531-Prymnesium_polylepis.2